MRKELTLVFLLALVVLSAGLISSCGSSSSTATTTTTIVAGTHTISGTISWAWDTDATATHFGTLFLMGTSESHLGVRQYDDAIPIATNEVYKSYITYPVPDGPEYLFGFIWQGVVTTEFPASPPSGAKGFAGEYSDGHMSPLVVSGGTGTPEIIQVSGINVSGINFQLKDAFIQP